MNFVPQSLGKAKISVSLTNSLYGKADRIKLSKKFFQHYLESCIITGRTEALEKVLNKHQMEPFGTVAELIGELQIEIVQQWNDFHKLWPQNTRPLTLEKVLKDQGFLE